jgi:hypothetical protein
MVNRVLQVGISIAVIWPICASAAAPKILPALAISG